MQSIPDPVIKDVLLETIKISQKELPFSLTIKDLEELLPFSDTKIYEMVKRNIIPAKKIDGKWVIPREKFLAWFYTNEEFWKELNIHG